MPFAHKPLSEEVVGAEVWKFTSPDAKPQMRQMAARGLAPLGPRDLVVALYQFWVTNEAGLADHAGKVITELPAKILGSALADKSLPPGVLDLLGRKLLRNGEVLDLVARHPAVSDETLTSIAKLCPEVVCNTLAANQRRWLKHPPILEALYNNPNCQMSVVHQMLELAVRERIDLRLPAMEEIRQALAESEVDESRDTLFQQTIKASTGVASVESEIDWVSGASVDERYDAYAAAVEEDEQDDEAFAGMEFLDIDGMEDMTADEAVEGASDAQKGAAAIGKLKPMEKIRLATLGSKFERSVLIRDGNRSVAMAVIKSPKVKENEAAAYSANRTLSTDVIRYIASNRDWTKLYQIKLNLVMNPKTPMSSAMTLLGFLHPHDVRKVARSKNIPSALVAAAKRRVKN